MESKESYHEIIKKDYLEKSNIPNILKKYNFNIDYIENEKNRIKNFKKILIMRGLM